ncbi:MAG: hypothetical protein WC657_09470 [Candidatus Paceibacterota bacterium]|jgi:hypothetical protein
MEIFEKFFLVVASGLYEVLVKNNGAEGFSACFKWMAFRSERLGEKDYRECWPIGESPPGNFIGVSFNLGIILLDPSYTRLEKPGQLPPYTVEDFNYNVAGTGYAQRIMPVVGMFLDYDAASNCFDSGQRSAWHSRWREQTQEVLRVMKKYPFFIYDREMTKRLP